MSRIHRWIDSLWKTLSSIRTGIVLLIITGIAAVAGTLILQRPLANPEDLARAYSPATLAWLDRLGLTDVFHAGWFLVLLGLLSTNIVLASLERLPVAWRYISRPYRSPEPHFLAGLPLHKEIPIRAEASGVDAAERALRTMGYRPQRVMKGTNVSLYAERNRFARLAAYVVHASLLLIFAGGIADGVWGYRGFMALARGESSQQIEMRDGTRKTLPFALRCEAAGQENYEDGSPKRWWSKLAVLENGREAQRKEIAVNEPLTYRGVRFFQSSYGVTGQVDSVKLTVNPRGNPAGAREIILRPDQPLLLDAGTSVQLAAFVPDFILAGKEVQSRSDQPNNPAIQLLVKSEKGGESKVWLFPRFPNFSHPGTAPYDFQYRDFAMGYFTGLQVSYEPGQWAVWGGVVLMGLGLAMAFYFIHVRVWAVPISDGRGRTVLWVGAAANKNREAFQERFARLVEAIEDAIPANRDAVAPARNQAAPHCGRADARRGVRPELASSTHH